MKLSQPLKTGKRVPVHTATSSIRESTGLGADIMRALAVRPWSDVTIIPEERIKPGVTKKPEDNLVAYRPLTPSGNMRFEFRQSGNEKIVIERRVSNRADYTVSRVLGEGEKAQIFDHLAGPEAQRIFSIVSLNCYLDQTIRERIARASLREWELEERDGLMSYTLREGGRTIILKQGRDEVRYKAEILYATFAQKETDDQIIVEGRSAKDLIGLLLERAQKEGFKPRMKPEIELRIPGKPVNN